MRQDFKAAALGGILRWLHRSKSPQFHNVILTDKFANDVGLMVSIRNWAANISKALRNISRRFLNDYGDSQVIRIGTSLIIVSNVFQTIPNVPQITAATMIFIFEKKNISF